MERGEMGGVRGWNARQIGWWMSVQKFGDVDITDLVKR